MAAAVSWQDKLNAIVTKGCGVKTLAKIQDALKNGANPSGKIDHLTILETFLVTLYETDSFDKHPIIARNCLRLLIDRGAKATGLFLKMFAEYAAYDDTIKSVLASVLQRCDIPADAKLEGLSSAIGVKQYHRAGGEFTAIDTVVVFLKTGAAMSLEQLNMERRHGQVDTLNIYFEFVDFEDGDNPEDIENQYNDIVTKLQKEGKTVIPSGVLPDNVYAEYVDSIDVPVQTLLDDLYFAERALSKSVDNGSNTLAKVSAMASEMSRVASSVFMTRWAMRNRAMKSIETTRRQTPGEYHHQLSTISSPIVRHVYERYAERDKKAFSAYKAHKILGELPTSIQLPDEITKSIAKSNLSPKGRVVFDKLVKIMEHEAV
jgi:hypothetical protein